MKDYDEGYVMNLHCGNSFDVDELKDMAKMMLEMGVRPTGYEVSLLLLSVLFVDTDSLKSQCDSNVRSGTLAPESTF